jgi:hypothetical protein
MIDEAAKRDSVNDRTKTQQTSETEGLISPAEHLSDDDEILCFMLTKKN